jgi:hypothetical protein
MSRIRKALGRARRWAKEKKRAFARRSLGTHTEVLFEELPNEIKMPVNELLEKKKQVGYELRAMYTSAPRGPTYVAPIGKMKKEINEIYERIKNAIYASENPAISKLRKIHPLWLVGHEGSIIGVNAPPKEISKGIWGFGRTFPSQPTKIK